jgi:hypothetical protein
MVGSKVKEIQVEHSCMPRKGGMLSSKALSPIALVMLYDP